MKWQQRQALSWLVYQLEDYEGGRWWRWWQKNRGGNLDSPRQRLKPTLRLRLMMAASWLTVAGFAVISLIRGQAVAAFGLIGIFWLFPGLIVGWAAIMFWPADRLVIWLRKRKVKSWFEQHPDLKVIGITGSYGKTSVKEILNSLLVRKFYGTSTPVNFNTVGGLARVVEAELSSSHQFFIAEMGAYKLGDIRQLAGLIRPDWGILTGVGPQHLERFGSVEVIAQAKCELIKAVQPMRAVVNWDNELIRRELIRLRLDRKVIKVGVENKEASAVISGIAFEPKELITSYELNFKEAVLRVKTPLFGRVQVMNTALAATLALELGLDSKLIETGLSQLHPAAHRLSLSRMGRAVVIDNTYSSNVDGFLSLIDDVASLKGKKALVTPGLVELGANETGYHELLATRAAAVFDVIVLAGNSSRTETMRASFYKANYKGDFSQIPNQTRVYWQTVEALAAKSDWICLENDLPDNYA